MRYIIFTLIFSTTLFCAVLGYSQQSQKVEYSYPAVEELTELCRKFHWMDSELYETISKSCNKYNVKINIVCAIIQQESRGNVYAVNKNRNGTTDHGLMQINSVHGVKKEIEENIDFGCKYLAYCMSKSDTLEQAISKYNTGANAKWHNKKYVQAVSKWL